jgi:hypothetical protein
MLLVLCGGLATSRRNAFPQGIVEMSLGAPEAVLDDRGGHSSASRGGEARSPLVAATARTKTRAASHACALTEVRSATDDGTVVTFIGRTARQLYPQR